MSKVTSYAPGTPCWVDLAATDIDASASFYADLLGWQAEEPNAAEMGGYRRAQLRGRRRRRADAEVQQPGQPQMWSTYVSVEDAAATAAKVSAAGGTVIWRRRWT